MAKIRECHVEVTTLTTVRAHGENGLRFELVRSADVERLYREAHRALVLVITVGTAQVHLRIDERPTNATTLPLSQYLHHKACTLHVSRPEEASKVSDALARHQFDLSCEGHKDPRCIPFFLFRRTESNDLGSESGRSQFVSHYSQGRSANVSALIDGEGREWASREFHSADLIHVAGTTLPVGFHWNVQTKKKTELANGWEVWRIGAHGYVNVHPDAHIRQGDRTFRMSIKSERLPPKTPRSKRKR
jgi:hypothetical protein